MTTPTHDFELLAQTLQSPISGNPLPQYGFGSEFCFDSLVQDNPFLFRVYTPKTRSRIFDDAAPPYFIGQKFNEHFTRAAEQLKDPSFAPGESVASALHVQRCCPAYGLDPEAYVPIYLDYFQLRLGNLGGHPTLQGDTLITGSGIDMHWNRRTFLCTELFPAPAILASVPLLSLIDKLPSYFLRQDRDPKSSPPSLDSLSWDTMERKPSFRQFCQDMSDQFLRLSAEHRLRDATGGSVRLAMAFLRPWFHRVVAKDFSGATNKACTLAFMIAQWPAQWWSRDHLEMWTVIRSLVQAVAEEVREKQKGEVNEEVRRLRDVVTDLERVVEDYEEAEETDDPNEESVVLPPTPPLSPPPSTPPSVIECLYPMPVDPTHAVSVPTPATQDVASVVPPVEGSDNSRPTTVIFSPTIIIHQQQQQEQCTPVGTHSDSPSPERGITKPRKTRSHSLAGTASCIITGVLVGAFITLCIVNSQRRTLIYVT
ncbi:hypothetical protein J3R82DRAFT_8082 [Butyriboletus roseoflavus]|nr:hypothetical protein J3R82DRAFT_8082 [Butyriboletus roseoflavus]